MNQSSKSIIERLLDDELFVQWVLRPTNQLDELWEMRMNEDEELKKSAETLKDILKNIRVEEPELSAKDKEAVWARIQSQINHDTKRKNRQQKLIIWATSVAASIILIAGGYWLIKGDGYIEEIDYSQYALNNDDLMRGENINLILSDNKRIDIDKDSVVIAYDAAGDINIDSEKIEKTAAADRKEKAVEMNRLIVPYGKTTSLILSDGTKVWMNSGSTLVYPVVFDKNKREIFLTGEALLDVAKDDKVPFIVKTNNVELNVLGTVFNVSAYDDDDAQSVVLVSGSVEVRSKNLQGSYKIKPNQRISYLKDSNEVNIQEVDVANYTSWVHGYLLVNSESLDNLLQKVARHFNRNLVFDKKSFKKESFTGKLDLRVSIETVLNYISVGTPISYTITDTDIHIKLSN